MRVKKHLFTVNLHPLKTVEENIKRPSNYMKNRLKSNKKNLPPNHLSLAAPYNNVGNMGDYSKAHSLYERAVENGQHSLPANHLTLQQRKKNLEDVKK